MRSTALANIAVGVVVERRRAKSAWVDFLWRPVSVFAGTPSAAPWTPLSAEAETTLFFAGEAVIGCARREVVAIICGLGSVQFDHGLSCEEQGRFSFRRKRCPGRGRRISGKNRYRSPQKIDPRAFRAAPLDHDAYWNVRESRRSQFICSSYRMADRPRCRSIPLASPMGAPAGLRSRAVG